MIEQISAAPPSPRARIAGVVYLFYFLTAISSLLFVGQTVIYNLVNLIANLIYLILTILFYFMFKPINRGVSLLAAFSGLMGCVIASLGLFHLSFQINPLLFFGPYCCLIGYLILRSVFLPKILGVLMALAGIGWLVYLSPLGDFLSLYIKILGILAEASLMLWLIVMGVNVHRWKEQVGSIRIKSEEK